MPRLAKCLLRCSRGSVGAGRHDLSGRGRYRLPFCGARFGRLLHHPSDGRYPRGFPVSASLQSPGTRLCVRAPHEPCRFDRMLRRFRSTIRADQSRAASRGAIGLCQLEAYDSAHSGSTSGIRSTSSLISYCCISRDAAIAHEEVALARPSGSYTISCRVHCIIKYSGIHAVACGHPRSSGRAAPHAGALEEGVWGETFRRYRPNWPDLTRP